MAKKIFLSFRYSDLNLRDNLRDLFQGRGGDIEATPAYLTEDVSDGGEEAVEDAIDTLMSSCRGLLVLIGKDTHSSNWVDKEIRVAASYSLPVAAVRHPQWRGDLSPRHAHIRTYDWNSPDLIREIARW